MFYHKRVKILLKSCVTTVGTAWFPLKFLEAVSLQRANSLIKISGWNRETCVKREICSMPWQTDRTDSGKSCRQETQGFLTIYLNAMPNRVTLSEFSGFECRYAIFSKMLSTRGQWKFGFIWLVRDARCRKYNYARLIERIILDMVFYLRVWSFWDERSVMSEFLSRSFVESLRPG